METYNALRVLSWVRRMLVFNPRCSEDWNCELIKIYKQQFYRNRFKRHFDSTNYQIRITWMKEHAVTWYQSDRGCYETTQQVGLTLAAWQLFCLWFTCQLEILFCCYYEFYLIGTKLFHFWLLNKVTCGFCRFNQHNTCCYIRVCINLCLNTVCWLWLSIIWTEPFCFRGQQ